MSKFLEFLNAGIERGGFSADDALAAILPLMRQVLQTHAAGKVAPLNGVGALQLTPEGHMGFDPAAVMEPRRNVDRVERVQEALSQAVDIIGHSRHTSDVDEGSYRIKNLDVSDGSAEITRPLFLPGYKSWEHTIDHHDELTDIFSLGVLLASMACGLDFTDMGDLELFAHSRGNLFALNTRLHPVIASLIGQMTELNRHRRAPDLEELIKQLTNYREQPVTDFDTAFLRIEGFKESPLAGKRRIIQTHLRDRLFEISRRNRLLYFKPTLQTLNLTVASVPLMLDYRNIRLDQLFVWHAQLAETIVQGSPMSLSKYLRFEDAPYIPGVLDKIMSEARRDRAEYGFGQLRLVLCFLRWNNLKEAPEERIHSPLLLLPVELTKKKGVRDHYVLDPTTTEAEVNPALRHHLKGLYNLDLPEAIDLRETTLQQFHQALQSQIRASEPGVTLNLIEKPQIELIHQRARMRLDQYQRRLKVKDRSRRAEQPQDYSYSRENFRPLGLQLFLEKVRPRPLPLGDVAGAPPTPRPMYIVDPHPPSEKTLETERQMFALREGDAQGNQNPYIWDLDLCSLTLGNFNYRKMTLVRDYTNLIEADRASVPFDTIFSLSPRPTEEESPPPLPAAEQHLIIPCDATQASAIAKVRGGRSYIIQGPPGTGKSQTITNLIADYVARGKRVLFVCEKRAAIDIVYHRLRQQGLDELCCLIHDSQTDKKEFVLNLKQTYEKFLNERDGEDYHKSREAALRAIDQDIAQLARFSEAMRQQHQACGVSLRGLLHRLIEVRAESKTLPELSPELEEQLPDYQLWLHHGELIGRLETALRDLGFEPQFTQRTVRWLRREVLESDRPLESIRACLNKAETLLEGVESALELSGLPGELWDTLEEINALLAFAARIRPLAEHSLLGLLNPSSAEALRYTTLVTQIEEQQRAHAQASEKAAGWKSPLETDDAQNALVQARGFEGSVFRFFQPAFWRLRKILRERYDFSRHAVAPSYTKVLEELTRLHQTRAALEETRRAAQRDWHTTDMAEFQRMIADIRSGSTHPSVRSFIQRLIGSPDSRALVLTLADIHTEFSELDRILAMLLAEHGQFDFDSLTNTLAALREEMSILPELMPLLLEVSQLPERFARALRYVDLPLSTFEPAMGLKSLNLVYREDRGLSRMEGRTLEQRLQRLESSYRELLKLNARCIRAAVRRKFREHVNVSSLPAAQLTEEQKAFKKVYSAGRRELEHEFGKSMRYKSIRDLAAGNSGKVIEDLKPIWLMSPLSVSDTLPLEPNLFDVVIFDEASQIPVEEAIPALYRSNQVIVVGDEMQLPPTSFFSAGRAEDEEGMMVEEEGERIKVDLDSDSFLTQSAINLPSTLLAWHYRSRYEALITFSNAAFYTGNLLTIPDRQLAPPERRELCVTAAEQASANVDATLERSISFHFIENGVYESRRNPSEANYIAELVRVLLQRETKLTIGIVAFSEAQQTEIEDALERVGDEDSAFAARLEAEFTREDNDQFCGLFVKNLENVQGDERDIIIMSVCYGFDAKKRMIMNFGPINKKGGEKRLNVIFSRAKKHMAIVSSIRHFNITNEYNEGANYFKRFLQYAESVSCGSMQSARSILDGLTPNRKEDVHVQGRSVILDQIKLALEKNGYEVAAQVGQSGFKCSLAVKSAQADDNYTLSILLDDDVHYANANLLEQYYQRPAILKNFGWRILPVFAKDWLHQPEKVLEQIVKRINEEPQEETEDIEIPLPESSTENNTPNVNPENNVNPVPAKTEPAATPYDHLVFKRYTLTDETSNKFWEAAVDDARLIIRFGRIGTKGQVQVKTFNDAAMAEREREKLIREKTGKGYVAA